jgi:hypothetical protein
VLFACETSVSARQYVGLEDMLLPRLQQVGSVGDIIFRYVPMKTLIWQVYLLLW